MRYAIAALVLQASTVGLLAAPAVDPARSEAFVARRVSIYHEPVDG